MKKILLFASALAGLFLAGSCQRESLEPVQQGNTVTYTVTVPDALATKGIGDNVANVNTLHYEVYRTAVAETVTFTDADRLLYHKTATVTNGTARIELELVNDQNFTVLFWAQVGETNEAYDVTDLTNVTLKSPIKANQVDYAAFSGVDFIEGTDALTDKTIELTRPVAQINLGTTEASLTAFDTRVGLDGSSMTVSGLSNTFNVAKQIPGAALTSTTVYDEKAVPAEPLKVNTTNYVYVGMNYVGFAPEVGTPVIVSYDINTTEGHIQNTIENVPVKPNYRTNIIGNLITSKTAYTVELDNTWGEPAEEIEVWDGKFISVPAKNDAGKYELTKASELAWLAAAVNGSIETRATAPAQTFKGETFVLTEDIDLGNFPWTPIGLTGDAAGFQGTFDGNGKTISNLYIDLTKERKYQSAGLFGSARDGVIKNFTVNNATIKYLDNVGNTSNGIGVVVGSAQFGLTIEGVTVKNVTVEGNRRVGGIAGYYRGTITGCTVDNANITATPDLLDSDKYDNGDKVGGLIGYANGTVILTGNTVKNFTVKGYRDAGGVAGYATDANNNISGNTVIDGSVILDRNYDYCEVKGKTAGAVLGVGTPGANTVTNVTVTNTDDAVDSQEAFAAAMANVADGGVVALSGEITTDVIAATGKTITIVGTTEDAVIKSVPSALNQNARLHTNGNITFKNITVSLPTNNDYFGGHDANGGTMVFDNCKFVGTVATINGNFTYNNCEFTNPDRYAAWVYGNSVVTYNNCSFTGKDRAVKVYAEHGYAPVVTYNNCTFDALSVNKTAVEIDCSNQTSGTPYYVTIINPTIENMGAAEHYAVGAEGVCNLETSGVGLGIVNIDGKGYSVAHTAAQLEALTNAGKDVTIQFAQGIAGDFTYEQNDNETVVIDGNGMTMNGTINVRARANVAIPVVIKNINFQTTDAERSFILSSESNRYPHITVSGCTFKGSGAESGVVPVTIKSAKNFVMENCTATKVHSLIQNTSGWNITIRNCEVTESGRGMALGTVQGATIENVKIDALDTKYGIRMDAGYNNNAIIKDCEISAFIPVVVRKASVNSTVVFNGTNTMTPANTDGLWCVIGTSEYEANGVMPAAPTAQVTVTLNDAGLDPAGVYGAAIL